MSDPFRSRTYQPQPPPSSWQPPVQPRRKSSKGTVITALLGLVVLGAAVGAYFIWQDEFWDFIGDNVDVPAVGPEVGECAVEGDDDLEAVDCADPAAEYEVLGRLERQTTSDYQDEAVCDAFPETDTVFFVTSARTPGAGTIFCLVTLEG